MSIKLDRYRESCYKSVLLSLNKRTKQRSIIKLIKILNCTNTTKYISFIPDLRNKYFVEIKFIKSDQNSISIEMPYLKPINISNFNPVNIVKNVLIPICNGIKYLHSNGIIHGGLKPNNLFVDESGSILISDAWHRFLYPSQVQNMIMEDLYYISPEMLESKPITSSSDIWNLGEVIYYCFNYCQDVVHSSNIKDLYKDIYNMKNNIDYNLIPPLFITTLKRIFSIDSSDRPLIEEIYNDLKKLLFDNCINSIILFIVINIVTSEDIFILLDEYADYINDTNTYEKLGYYFINDNDCFFSLINRINNSTIYKQSYTNILMIIALKDEGKRMYILKHLKYNNNTKEYFKMIKIVSGDNAIEIDYDKNYIPFYYANYYVDNVYSFTIKDSKPNAMIKSYYEFLHLLYPFTNLKQLTIRNIQMNDQMEKILYSVLRRNSQIVDFSCTDLCLTKVNFNYIRLLILFYTNLRKLSISSDNVSDDVIDLVLPYVTSLHNLKELDLSHNKIKALTNLPPLVSDTPTASSSSNTSSSITMSTPSNVQTITCHNNNLVRKYGIQPELLHPFFALDQLEILNLEYNQIDDIFLPKLFKMIPTYNLKSINISANSFSDVGFILFCSLLTKIPQLEDLSFDSNKLTDTSMNYFATHLSYIPNIRSLKIGSFLFFRSPISDGSIDKFSCYLSCIPKLENLTITDTDMTDDGFFSISERFSLITNLQKLSISFHKSTPLVFKEICSSLYFFEKLKHLDFSWNELGDTFISILSQYFSIVSGLESLVLNENCIQDIGIKALSKNLHYLSNLQELLLSRNKIQDDGLLDISKQFSSIQKLRNLDLSINNISDKGIMYMSGYISSLSNLKYLSFACNRKLTNTSNSDFVNIITQLDRLERLDGVSDLPEDISVRLK